MTRHQYIENQTLNIRDLGKGFVKPQSELYNLEYPLSQALLPLDLT
jgi:hypothetical protein